MKRLSSGSVGPEQSNFISWFLWTIWVIWHRAHVMELKLSLSDAFISILVYRSLKPWYFIILLSVFPGVNLGIGSFDFLVMLILLLLDIKATLSAFIWCIFSASLQETFWVFRVYFWLALNHRQIHYHTAIPILTQNVQGSNNSVCFLNRKKTTTLICNRVISKLRRSNWGRIY